jgi:hypothetical protein
MQLGEEGAKRWEWDGGQGNVQGKVTLSWEDTHYKLMELFQGDVN